jgi:protein-S-isoprenylcysteine O-methyltransferase Ste14
MILLYFISALSLLAVAYGVFRVLVRREYCVIGHLSPLGGFLELLVWIAFVCFPYLYNPSEWWVPWTADVPVSPILKFIGLLLLTAGIVLALVGMATLGMSRTFGQQSEGVIQTGLYRVSRNPQLVAMHMMVLGIVILWPSLYALGWLLLGVAIGQMMVRTEEEHLQKKFGDTYAQYCKRVPRYIGRTLSEGS